jgi:acetyl-CoA synthetase
VRPVNEEGQVSATQEGGLSALLHETRTFPLPADLAQAANAQAGIYAEADADRIGFWEGQARGLEWAQPWSSALEWDLPNARWFVGGTLNVAVNCVDRHVEAGRGDRVAFHWEGEPGDTRTITYADLLAEVCRAANALTELGVRAGDKVAIYLPTTRPLGDVTTLLDPTVVNAIKDHMGDGEGGGEDKE